MKDNNEIHLEDELGDILRDYFNLLEGLVDEGKISSVEKIIQRAEEKYTERVEAILDTKMKSGAWKKVKEIQKEKLQKEHNEKYGR